ncbi:MAG: DUF5714 domain-containing protein [Dehalobacterium sp.]
MSNICCPNGHYVCDICHGKDVFEMIRNYLMSNSSQNPFKIAATLMSYHNVPMLGCENAWIAAGAFVTALKNQDISIITNDQIGEVLNRTRRQAIGGYCGLTGVCGIVPAIGACFSVILEAACPKDEETAKTMKIVGKVVNAIADQTGPCCCKNFVWTSLRVAIDSAKEVLNVSLPGPGEEIFCIYSDRHPHGCRKEKCPYFKR